MDLLDSFEIMYGVHDARKPKVKVTRESKHKLISKQ